MNRNHTIWFKKGHTSLKRGSMTFCFLLLSGYVLFAQRAEVSLSACRDSAYANYPLIRKYDLIQKSRDYSLSNIKKGYLPQGSFGAQATWQSEVTTIPIEVPGLAIPKMSKDQYRAQLEISQLVYDGGRIHANREILKQKAMVDTKEWEVNMYTVYQRVDELYFGILLLGEQLRLNELLQDDLRRSKELLQAGMTQGVATQTDLDEVSVTLLDADQQRIALQSNIEAYCRMLSRLTGMRLDSQTLFKRPSGKMPQQWENHRPELAWIDAGAELINKRRSLLTSNNLPVFSLFVQGLYGRPGLNMLRNQFDFGWMGGIRLSYSFAPLYTLKKDRLLLSAESERLQIERHTFLFNTDIALIGQQQNLKQVIELMGQDDEIIRLRDNIVKASEAKLLYGTILTNDMLRDISAKNRALQQKALHEIESLQIIWKMKQLVNHE